MTMAKLFGNIYQNKSVLITGDTGFKGSWLSLWLLELGAKLSGVSKDYPSDPSHSKLLKLNYSQNKLDILNLEKLIKAVKKEKPEIIFHLAAQALVRKSYKEPLQTFATNAIGSAHVIEAARACKSVKAIVIITTDKCYENKEWSKGYKESDALGGFDPYSASKACAEILSHSYRQAFSTENSMPLLATARSGNVIGGADWGEDRLIPDLVRSFSKNKVAQIRNPKATRPWQHVLEPLSGYLLLGQRLLEGKADFESAWNFGPSQKEIAVSKLLKDIKQEWPKIEYRLENKKQVHEATRLKLNSNKAKTKLQWRNVWGYKQSIKKTADWYKSYYNDRGLITKQQLDNYIIAARKKDLIWTK